MTAVEVIRAVKQVGGSLEVSGDRVHYRLPREAGENLVEELRFHKEAIIAALRRQACWHCGGAGRCRCIACWRVRPSEAAECIICRGSDRVRAVIQ